MTEVESPLLELDDIQSGALYERPSPYVGTYLLLRIDDRTAGRELVSRLHALAESQRASTDPARDTSITIAFTYHGLQALGVPQTSLDSFAREFRAGMAARAAELGDVGDSSPEHWEKPFGHYRRACSLGRPLPRPGPASGRGGGRAARPVRASGRRADLAAGLLPAAHWSNVVRFQGRHRSGPPGKAAADRRRTPENSR